MKKEDLKALVNEFKMYKAHSNFNDIVYLAMLEELIRLYPDIKNKMVLSFVESFLIAEQFAQEHHIIKNINQINPEINEKIKIYKEREAKKKGWS